MKDLFKLFFGSAVEKASLRRKASVKMFDVMATSLRKDNDLILKEIDRLDHRISRDSADRAELIELEAKNERLADRLFKFLDD